mgnify:CR=1 FL=1
MSSFALALSAFVLIHVGISATGLRRALVAGLGEGAYRIAFSIVSLGLLVWLIHAYGAMRSDPFDPLTWPLWAPPDWLRGPAMGLIVLGVVLAVAGVLTPGPTYAGFERSVAKADAAQGVLRITRHPFLWGVAFWAAGHALVNGERFALMLFGGLGLMVVLGTRSIDRKGRARNPEAWANFEEVTSNLPFAAITQGRNKLVLGEMWWRVLLGVGVCAAIVFYHGAAIGVSVLSTAP